MLGKEKEKNLYTMLIAVWSLFTFVTIIFVYAIVDTKLNVTNEKVERLEKFLDLQYAQIWGEENYETALKISELSKEENKKQMEDYLKNLEAQKEAQGNLAPLPFSPPAKSNSEVIELSDEDINAPIEIIN